MPHTDNASQDAQIDETRIGIDTAKAAKKLRKRLTKDLRKSLKRIARNSTLTQEEKQAAFGRAVNEALQDPQFTGTFDFLNTSEAKKVLRELRANIENTIVAKSASPGAVPSSPVNRLRGHTGHAASPANIQITRARDVIGDALTSQLSRFEQSLLARDIVNSSQNQVTQLRPQFAAFTPTSTAS